MSSASACASSWPHIAVDAEATSWERRGDPAMFFSLGLKHFEGKEKLCSCQAFCQMSAPSYFYGPAQTPSWRAELAGRPGGGDPGRSCFNNAKNDAQSPFLSSREKKGFPNTKKKSFKIKFTR